MTMTMTTMTMTTMIMMMIMMMTLAMMEDPQKHCVNRQPCNILQPPMVGGIGQEWKESSTGQRERCEVERVNGMEWTTQVTAAGTVRRRMKRTGWEVRLKGKEHGIRGFVPWATGGNSSAWTHAEA